MPMTLVFYISGHGFGHATRDIEILNAVHEQDPSVHVVIRSAVPRWICNRSMRGPFELQRAETDTGMVQIDSLTFDETATIEHARAFYGTFAARVDAEVEALAACGATIVAGDIPPLAFAAAARGGVRSIAIGNFTWDWIYEAFPAFHRHAADVLEVIRRAYASATLALRLPFAGGFAPMAAVTRDVPLVARRSRIGRNKARRLLKLDPERPLVLASFGGYGLRLPYDRIANTSEFSVAVTDDGSAPTAESPIDDRVRRFSQDDLARHNVRYEDLVAASDVVVSKPGYGIVSECIANGAALLYTSRGRFVEQEIFEREMPAYLRCRFIDVDDLRAGRWHDAVRDLLAQPPAPKSMDVNGASTVARALLGVR